MGNTWLGRLMNLTAQHRLGPPQLPGKPPLQWGACQTPHPQLPTSLLLLFTAKPPSHDPPSLSRFTPASWTIICSMNAFATWHFQSLFLQPAFLSLEWTNNKTPLPSPRSAPQHRVCLESGRSPLSPIPKPSLLLSPL